MLGAQYSAFEPLPGAQVNGDLTMGENIADLGGLTLALDAYHASLKGQPAPVIDGLTGDQRVFLGWAQVWRGKIRDDALRRQLVSDPHSPRQSGSTARCATSTPGTRPSASSRATSSTSRPRSGCGSGRTAPAHPVVGPAGREGATASGPSSYACFFFAVGGRSPLSLR